MRGGGCNRADSGRTFRDPLDQLSGALGMLVALLLAGCFWWGLVEHVHGVGAPEVCVSP